MKDHNFIYKKSIISSIYNLLLEHFVCENCNAEASKWKYTNKFIITYTKDEHLTCEEIIIKNIIE